MASSSGSRHSPPASFSPPMPVPPCPRRLPGCLTRSRSPRRYVLSQNLTYSGTAIDAITISADNVVLDLQDWTITYGADLGLTHDISAIRADFRHNITIRNGTIRGFHRGIYLEGDDTSGGHLVETSTLTTAPTSASS